MTSALTTTQYNLLRGAGYAGTRLLSLFSNRVVFSGDLVIGSFLAAPWAEFNYTNTTGSYSDILPGMVILCGNTTTLSEMSFRGRIRKAATATTIYIGETSVSRGALTKFAILDTYEPQAVLSRPSTNDPATQVEIVDWDVTYQGLLPCAVGLQTAYAGYIDPATSKLRLGFDLSASFGAESGSSISSYAFTFPNATLVAGSLSSPLCIMDFPVGEQWGKFVLTDGGSRALTRHFGIKVHDHTSNAPDTGFEGGSIGMSLEQGATLTIPAFTGVDSVLPNTFAICWRGDELYAGASGSLFGGGSAHVSNKVLTANVATLTTSAAHPFAVGQTVIVADVDAVFNGTHVITAVASTTFSFAKTNANVGSAACSGEAVVNPQNVDFVGWLHREDDPARGDPTYGVTTAANFTFTGVGPRLGRLEVQRLAILAAASPTLWREMVNPTPWRVIWHYLTRYSTIATLCDITFDDVTNKYLFPEWSTEGENILACLQWLGQSINALPEYYPSGRIHIPVDVNYVALGDRSAYTPLAAWTNDDAFEITRSFDPNPSVGKVDGDGAVYDSASGVVTPFTGRAPGTAQGEAQGSDTLPGQILASTSTPAAALAELLNRIGARLEVDNLKEFLDVLHPDGHVGALIRPGRSAVYTWTLASVGGTQGVNRITYTTDTWWTIESVTTEYNQKIGAFVHRVRYRKVIGASAAGADTTQHIPAPGSTPIALPDPGLPPFNFELPQLTFPADAGVSLAEVNPGVLLPPIGQAVDTQGQSLIVWNSTHAWFLRNAITLTVPQATDITPADLGSYAIKQCLVDPFSDFKSGVGAYLLGYSSSGGVSAVWYTAHSEAPVPLWTKGADVSGQFNVLRAGNAAGAVLMYGSQITLPPSDCAPFYYNFRVSTYDWTLDWGTWSAGNGVLSVVHDGSNYVLVVTLACTQPLVVNSTIQVKWYMNYNETQGNRYVIKWRDINGNVITSSGGPALGPGEVTCNYSTGGTANAYGISWDFYPTNSATILRSIEIINP